jgi:multiple sugar transport system ATP-binding protein
MTMGHRVAVMRKGELQQVAPPQELYDRPVNLFVGGFIGSPAMNLVESSIERRNGGFVARVGEAALALDESVVQARPDVERFVDKPVILGIRPESLEDAALEPDTPADRKIHGVVVLREPLGSEIVAHFDVKAPPALTEDVRELARDVGQEAAVRASEDEARQETTMVGRFGPRSRAKTGDTIDVAVDTSGIHLFDPETGLGIYGERGGANGSSTSTKGAHG